MIAKHSFTYESLLTLPLSDSRDRKFDPARLSHAKKWVRGHCLDYYEALLQSGVYCFVSQPINTYARKCEYLGALTWAHTTCGETPQAFSVTREVDHLLRLVLIMVVRHTSATTIREI